METFPNNYCGAILDKARFNDRAFLGMQADFPEAMFLRLPCDVHIISTVTGRTYGVVDGAISGFVASALAMRMGGAFTCFKQCPVELLAGCVDVIKAPPPPQTGQRALFRDALLHQRLPDCNSAVKRAAALKELLQGDITRNEIPLYWLQGASDAEVRTWATALAANLMLARLDIFPRT
eukprot:8479965-Heterocapsa_arctica.AAC.2